MYLRTGCLGSFLLRRRVIVETIIDQLKNITQIQVG